MSNHIEYLITTFIDLQQTKGVRNTKKLKPWLMRFAEWMADRGLEVQTVTPLAAEEFQTWVVTLEDDGIPHYATATVADIVGVVDGFYRWLKDTHVVGLNPFYRMKRIKTEQRLPREVPNQTEMLSLLEHLRTFWTYPFVKDQRIVYRLHVIAELLYASGMRITELSQLTAQDIDWNGHIIHIRCGKGGKARDAYLNEYATRVLRVYVEEMAEAVNYVHDSPQLFGGMPGRDHDTTLNAQMKKRLGFTSHTFRHALGTHLLQRGCDLRFIQLILGHEDLESTAVYAKVSKEDLRRQIDRFHPRGGSDQADVSEVSVS